MTDADYELYCDLYDRIKRALTLSKDAATLRIDATDMDFVVRLAEDYWGCDIKMPGTLRESGAA